MSIHKLLLFLANQHSQQRLVLWIVYDFWVSHMQQHLKNPDIQKELSSPIDSLMPAQGSMNNHFKMQY